MDRLCNHEKKWDVKNKNYVYSYILQHKSEWYMDDIRASLTNSMFANSSNSIDSSDSTR